MSSRSGTAAALECRHCQSVVDLVDARPGNLQATLSYAYTSKKQGCVFISHDEAYQEKLPRVGSGVGGFGSIEDTHVLHRRL